MSHLLFYLAKKKIKESSTYPELYYMPKRKADLVRHIQINTHNLRDSNFDMSFKFQHVN